MTKKEILRRGRGCLLGQLAGDSLGSLVEFQTPEAIRRRYPKGVRVLLEGGTWNTLAGQPTDDSEMALALARNLVRHKSFKVEEVRKDYRRWLDSNPFDCGNTVSAGLRGKPNPGSQANGALMRISPLGIFGFGHPPDQVAEWAKQDAEITHPHPICVQANVLFVAAIASAIRDGLSPEALYGSVREHAGNLDVETGLMAVIESAEKEPPREYVFQQGWVLIALQNALWQLLHARDLESGVVDTVMRGGDTDTNAAICGALLGAVYGDRAIPRQWTRALRRCKPDAGNPRVAHSRPREYWPVDAPALAQRLMGVVAER